ncbi:ATP-dependent zinc protease family protein [Altererythrobacter sp. C41]|uniref:ATP-dependent zinc protease family protein n=1 Tax=Altererythrobacter sp. C41 TaxID=2806021 RepID=UPI001934148F|nr:RimK/LysX family protein [Altererythrobacter sp. C41]MBM0169207.1 ATP-dependent zinc protease [Altererythrobacter sp. C41]
MSAKKEPLPAVGWRELVALPELGLAAVPAKIDTGARTSSLHATVLDRFERDGTDYVRFAVDFGRQHVRQVCEAIQVDRRGITSSNGETQMRLIVKTPMRIGAVEFRAEISLADRSDMQFPLLIGRTALRRRFVVDSGSSWLQSPGRMPRKDRVP